MTPSTFPRSVLRGAFEFELMNACSSRVSDRRYRSHDVRERFETCGMVVRVSAHRHSATVDDRHGLIGLAKPGTDGEESTAAAGFGSLFSQRWLAEARGG